MVRLYAYGFQFKTYNVCLEPDETSQDAASRILAHHGWTIVESWTPELGYDNRSTALVNNTEY